MKRKGLAFHCFNCFDGILGRALGGCCPSYGGNPCCFSIFAVEISVFRYLLWKLEDY
jgi:hypothetical protein